MRHLDPEVLMALRDGISIPGHPEHARHLAGCEECVEALEGMRAQGLAVARALASLDEEWDLEKARSSVRRSLEDPAAVRARELVLGGPGLGGRTRSATWSLSRAAGLILIAAGAASALPGSPVRSWLSSRAAAPETEAGAAGLSTAAMDTTEPSAGAIGIRVAVTEAPLRIRLHAAAPGTDVRVRWVPGAEAAILAPAGSRFSSGDGHLDATLASGPVTVEIPAQAPSISLLVGDRLYLRRAGGNLTLSVDPATQSSSEVLFRVPGG